MNPIDTLLENCIVLIGDLAKTYAYRAGYLESTLKHLISICPNAMKEIESLIATQKREMEN